MEVNVELNDSQLLRLDDVSKLTSLGKSTINLWVIQGKFPVPTALSKTIKVWKSRDVLDWIENQTQGRPTASEPQRQQ